MFNKRVMIVVFLFSLIDIVSCSKTELLTFFPNEETNLQDVSFTIEISNNVGQLTMFNKDDLVILIRQHLERTGKYRQVLYSAIPEQKKTKHLHFHLIVTRTKDTDQPIWGAISRLTLLTIPRAIQYYSDFSVFSFLDNKEVFSATATDKFNSIIWLPMIVLNPIVNDFVVSKLVLDHQLPILLQKLDRSH